MDPRSPRTLAVVATFTALVSACGGGGSAPAPAAPAPAPAPAPLAEGMLRDAQPGELVASFKARIEQRSSTGLAGTDARDIVTVGVATPTGVPAPTPAPVAATAGAAGFS